MIIRIPKRGGGFREICCQPLKYKGQARQIAYRIGALLAEAEVAGVVHGFVAGRSPITNALAHAGHRYFYTVDLADFFGHCTRQAVEDGLVPLSFQNNRAEVRSVLADAFLFLRRILGQGSWPDVPQGLSFSPALANGAGVVLDRLIIRMLPEGVTYTRYADDLTFSSNERGLLEEVAALLPDRVRQAGQEINRRKTRWQSLEFGSVEVTGVMLRRDGRLNATRSFRRKLRAARHRLAMLRREKEARRKAGDEGGAEQVARLVKRQRRILAGMAAWYYSVKKTKLPSQTSAPETPAETWKFPL